MYFITFHNILVLQVLMVQSRGSRGFQLVAATTTSLSFPASQIFTNCETFPREFSIVITLKIKELAERVSKGGEREKK